MKIAHFTQFAPRRSGLYEVTRDQIICERKAGLDSRFIDCNRENPPDTACDGPLKIEGWSRAEDCDIWVMHRSIPKKLQPEMKKHGCVVVLHAVADFMMLAEGISKARTTEFNFNINLTWGKDLGYDRTIAVNQSDYDIMSLYDANDRLRMIQEGVDLERFSLEGWAWQFKHHPAIMASDVPRMNKLPAHIIWSMPKVVEKIPDARLNVYGLDLNNIVTWRNLLVRSKGRKTQAFIEEFQLRCDDLRPFMKGADILFNSNINGVPCRNLMEGMACGLTPVSYRGDYTKFHAMIWDLDSIADNIFKCWNHIKDDPEKAKLEARAYAEKTFDMTKTVEEYVKMYEEIKK